VYWALPEQPSEGNGVAVSSQNEGEQPSRDPDSLGSFDAFRARQADDRAQQQTQGPYAFPPEYAVDPPEHLPPAQAPREGGGRRLRSIAVFAGAVVLAVAVGFGAYEAVGSSGPAANVTTGAGASTPQAAATGTATPAGKRGRAVDVLVVIESIGADSFTGHIVSTGEHVTVQLGASTRFGTVARPFSRDQLSVGETVGVRGRRSAADTLAATVVVGG
jgi:hypothetical protein